MTNAVHGRSHHPPPWGHYGWLLSSQCSQLFTNIHRIKHIITKGRDRKWDVGQSSRSRTSLITMANCHPLYPLVCHSFKQQCGRISPQTFEWICSGRTSCITCGTHDNYGRINTGGFMALLPRGIGCQIDTGLVFEQHTWVQTPTRLQHFSPQQLFWGRGPLSAELPVTKPLFSFAAESE